MNSKQSKFIGLTALALLIALAPLHQAAAALKVRATVTTPHLAVRVDTDSGPAFRYGHLRPLTARYGVMVRLDRQDRRIARRLAEHTGLSRQELLQMRLHGYSWQEIGGWLNLRPQVVRAAADADSWERFLHGQRPGRVVRCATR